jgi:translation initiation factor IF-2
MPGSFVVAGDAYAPVRFIEDFRGARVEQANPSEPARISGFSKLPSAGTPFTTVSSRKEAEALCAATELEVKRHAKVAPHTETADGIIELPLVVKADVAGSVDAILHELKKITHERVALSVVTSGVGAVSESDVKAAYACSGTVIAFNTPTEAGARDLALRDGVPIETFSIIYELSQRISDLVAARAPKMSVEKELGRGTVIKTFSSGTKKQVLGVRLVSGTFAVGNVIKIVRRDIEIARGSIQNLQQARADVKEIKTEGEFGTEISAKEDAAPGDVLVAFTTIES